MMKIVRDPSPSEFKRQVLVSAIAIFILAILVIIFAKVAIGALIALLSAVFAVGSQVSIKQSK